MALLTCLELRDFKGFRDARIDLKGFNLLIGANAAGKSNIRDALRFLHGISRGYSLAETLGGRYQDGVQVWSGIRGGSRDICRKGSSSFSLTTAIRNYRYRIKIEVPRKRASAPRLAEEGLFRGSTELYSTRRPQNSGQDHIDVLMIGGGNYKRGHKQTMARSAPALTRIEEWLDDADRNDFRAGWLLDGARRMLETLRGMRFMDIAPDATRIPSIPGETQLGERGENLSSVIQHLCEDQERKQVLASWLEQLTPMDVVDFDFATDASGRILVELVEADGTKISANSASDGTLRFLALLAALTESEPGRTYFLEEIDNGLHPTRLDLLMQLIENHTADSRIAIIATTHSPPLLRLLGPHRLDQGFVCWRPEGHNEARITRVADIEAITQVLEQNDLARLHESSWFQDVLAFMADAEDEEDAG
jgi:predicted ATPase